MYLFNPDNDLALANFDPNYTPPASAVKLKSDLELLPVWYSQPNSLIVVENKRDCHEFMEQIKKLFPIDCELIAPDETDKQKGRRISPWGWSPMLRKKLSNYGVSDNKLPSDTELETIRNYSNRKHAVKMLDILRAENQTFCGEAHYFTSRADVLRYLSSFQGDKALKMPLSGSGRGLIWIKGEITDKQTDWCRRVIQNQGGIVAEPFLNKVQDFAMEFYLNHREIDFTGYSLFQSAASGAYTGNTLVGDNDIEKELSRFVSQSVLHGLRNRLIELLPQFFPEYQGYLGVDMMICETEKEEYCVQPCVEINMRMNMGVVAHLFYKRFVKQGLKGIYKVDFFKNNPDALLFHNNMQKELPLIVENGRISSGYLSLIPVTEQTNYIAYAAIEQPVK